MVLGCGRFLAWNGPLNYIGGELCPSHAKTERVSRLMKDGLANAFMISSDAGV